MKLFPLLLLLFTIIPLIELYILITIGSHVGAWNTVFFVILTGLSGAWLARQQGMSVLWKIRKTLSEGKMPAEELLDGVMILIAAVLLITPGVVTDIVGILLLIPPVRALIKGWIKKKIQDWINRGGRSIHINIQ